MRRVPLICRLCAACLAWGVSAVGALASAGEAPAAAPSQVPLAIPLWANGAPGFEAKRDLPEIHLKSGAIAGVHNPSVTLFLPDRSAATGAGVVILPGGGHKMLAIEHEGYAVGRWMAAHGIAGFVLKYRLAKEDGSVYRVDVEALHDAQRAIRLVRNRAVEWGLDPARIGVIGFSAGGELAALVSMQNDAGNPAAADPVDRQGCKPAFQALIYPGQSQRIAPTQSSPPAFLACGYNDREDISSGLARVYLLFKQAHVPAELHIYTGTGHGFGINPINKKPSAGWPDRFDDWLGERGFLKK